MSYQITHKDRVAALCVDDMTMPEYAKQITQMAQELAEKLDAVMAMLEDVSKYHCSCGRDEICSLHEMRDRAKAIAEGKAHV